MKVDNTLLHNCLIYPIIFNVNTLVLCLISQGSQKPVSEIFVFSTVRKQNWRRPFSGEGSPDIRISGLPKGGNPDNH